MTFDSPSENLKSIEILLAQIKKTDQAVEPPPEKRGVERSIENF